MAMAAGSAPPLRLGWLRNRDFDIAMIVGLVAVSLLAGIVIVVRPNALGLILLADAWLFGYPHVAATFARLAPDRASLVRNRFLVFGLPVLVLAVTAGLTVTFGFALIATIYFYWQWYHTMRQSWGIAQLYRRRSPVPVRENPVFAEALFALVPLWGLLHRMSTAPDHFIYPNLPLILPAVPPVLANAAGGLALAGLAWWAVARAREAIAGELPVVHTLFSASHYLIFIVGYVAMDNIAGGWVVTNIWHTAQYLMLVWLFNQNAVAKGATQGWFLNVTQGNRAARYFALCLFLAVPVYFIVTRNFLLGPTGLIAALVVTQTLNFHHFIVDAVIWRKRRAPQGAPA